MEVLNNWDSGQNFWVVNPQFKILDKISGLYKGDKSKDKLKSSNVMWAIATYSDFHSVAHNYPKKDRILFVNKEFFNDKSDKIENYKDLCDEYEKIQETPALRHLKIWEAKMDEKSELLKMMAYTRETAEFIEKVLASNKTLYVEYERIKNSLMNEGEGGRIFGGGEESLIEKGDFLNDD